MLIDCGEDWLGRIDRLRPTAILVTHGHPDHAAGLKQGAPCPVYATAETWRVIGRWPLAVRCVLRPFRPATIAGFAIEAWPVEHSLNAPAVGFKVSARGVGIFYVPDVAAIRNPVRTLRRVDLYVGDGAVLDRPLVRQRGPVVIGHASMATQLDWCKTGGVRRAVFTHCGSAIVRAKGRSADRLVHSLGRERGIDARLAYDGLTMTVGNAPANAP